MPGSEPESEEYLRRAEHRRQMETAREPKKTIWDKAKEKTAVGLAPLWSRLKDNLGLSSENRRTYLSLVSDEKAVKTIYHNVIATARRHNPSGLALVLMQASDSYKMLENKYNTSTEIAQVPWFVNKAQANLDALEVAIQQASSILRRWNIGPAKPIHGKEFSQEDWKRHEEEQFGESYWPKAIHSGNIKKLISPICKRAFANI